MAQQEAVEEALLLFALSTKTRARAHTHTRSICYSARMCQGIFPPAFNSCECSYSELVSSCHWATCPGDGSTQDPKPKQQKLKQKQKKKTPPPPPLGAGDLKKGCEDERRAQTAQPEPEPNFRQGDYISAPTAAGAGAGANWRRSHPATCRQQMLRQAAGPPVPSFMMFSKLEGLMSSSSSSPPSRNPATWPSTPTHSSSSRLMSPVPARKQSDSVPLPSANLSSTAMVASVGTWPSVDVGHVSSALPRSMSSRSLEDCHLIHAFFFS